MMTMIKTLLFLFFWSYCLPGLFSQEETLADCQKRLQRAQQTQNRDSLAQAYLKLSEYYAYRNSDTTRHYCQLGLKQVRPSDVPTYLTLLINEAETYYAQGQLQEAIRRYQFIRKEAIAQQADLAYLTTTLGSLAVSYRRTEKNDSALLYYQEALTYLEQTDNPDEEVYILTNMAILYTNTDRLKEGDYFIQKAMQRIDQCQDMDMVMYAGSTAGIIASKLHQPERANQYLHQVIRKGVQENKPRFALKGITHLLHVFITTHQEDSIDFYLQEASQLAAQLPQGSTEVLGFQETQYQLLLQLGRHRESLGVQQRMLQNHDMNIQTSRDKFYYQMAQNQAALKAYPEAIQCYEIAHQWADSLKQLRQNEQLSVWTAKFQTQEKEMEIARLRQQQLEDQSRDLKRGILTIIVIFILLIGLIYGQIRKKQQQKQEELRVARSYIEGLERERSRLAKDLHDGVCNDLLGVGMQLSFLPPTEATKQEILHLLEHIRQDVRSISHELMPPKFQQLTLCEAIEAYLDRLSNQDKYRFTFRHQADGPWKQVPEPRAYEVYRILQEWLANVWKHAQPTQVEVELKLTSSQLFLNIRNDGPSLQTAPAKNGGIGMTTIRERVKSLEGNLTIHMQEQKQIFELIIPLNPKKRPDNPKNHYFQ